MQVTIVNAVPLFSAAAFCATKVENKGESAVTTMPQNTKNPIHKYAASEVKTNGESKQQQQERSKAVKATLFAPNIWAI